MLAVSTTNTTVFAAFAVGVVSFVSPCVLPLVPGYLSAVSGISLAEIRTGERSLSKLLIPSVIFCLSFTVMFVLLGMSATKLGSTLSDHRLTLNRISGGLIIVTGTAVLFTGNDPSDSLRSLQAILTLPEFLWELFLGIYCTFKGFRPSSAILRDDAREDRVRTVPVPTPA